MPIRWRARLSIAASQFAAGHGHAALALRLRAGSYAYLSLSAPPRWCRWPAPA